MARLEASEMANHANLARIFGLAGRVAVITGGAGLLGRQHAKVIAAAGGIPVIADLPIVDPEATAAQLSKAYGVRALGWPTDITDPEQVDGLLTAVLDRFGSVDILINNAANNPKVEAGSGPAWSRLENLPLDV